SSSAKRKRCAYDGSGPGGTLEPELSAEGFDAVGESPDPRAAGEAGAASAVVADLYDDCLVRPRQLDARFGGIGVLRGIGEAFGDDVVDGGFDCFGKTVYRNASDRDREGRAVGEGLKCGGEAAVGEDGWVESAGEFPECF